MIDQTNEDNNTMKQIATVVVGLIALSFGLIMAVNIIVQAQDALSDDLTKLPSCSYAGNLLQQLIIDTYSYAGSNCQRRERYCQS